MFTSHPTYSMYRTLKATTPHQRGEDVYALQTALIEIGISLPLYGADGDLGNETATGILAAQRKLGLTVDGLAGSDTQKALALRIASKANTKYSLPVGALRGQIEHESSFRLGAYSVVYSDGSYDCGVVQMNSGLTPPKQGFNAAHSIDQLGLRIRTYYDKFAGLKPFRRWSLAQGAWNAPAFACWVARNEGATSVPTSECLKPTEDQLKTFEAYVASVSAYLQA